MVSEKEKLINIATEYSNDAVSPLTFRRTLNNFIRNIDTSDESWLIQKLFDLGFFHLHAIRPFIKMAQPDELKRIAAYLVKDRVDDYQNN